MEQRNQRIFPDNKIFEINLPFMGGVFYFTNSTILKINFLIKLLITFGLFYQNFLVEEIFIKK
jgi:hypothetical protein